MNIATCKYCGKPGLIWKKKKEEGSAEESTIEKAHYDEEKCIDRKAYCLAIAKSEVAKEVFSNVDDVMLTSFVWQNRCSVQ